MGFIQSSCQNFRIESITGAKKRAPGTVPGALFSFSILHATIVQMAVFVTYAQKSGRLHI